MKLSTSVRAVVCAMLVSAPAHAGITVGSVAVLSSAVFQLGWTFDDPQILAHALQYSPRDYLFRPAAWRAYSWVYFSPLLNLSFDVDTWVFGLNVRGYYLHQFAAVTVAILAFWALLRRFLAELPALAGSALLLLGPPLWSLPQQLSLRHYAEGLALALAAAWYYVRFVETGRATFGVFASSFYLGAMLAKEAFPPLLLIFVVLPVGRFADRWRRAMPLAGVLGVYLTWRAWMLGAVFRTYTPDSGGFAALKENLGHMSRQLGPVLLGLDRSGGRIWIYAMVVTLFLLAILVPRRPRSLLFWGWALAVALAPFVPVAKYLDAHYVILAWCVIAAMVAAGIDSWIGRRAGFMPAMALFLVTASWAFHGNRAGWRTGLQDAKRRSAEGRFFLEKSKASDVLRNPSSALWYFDGLAWIRRTVLKQSEPAVCVTDDSYFCDRSEVHVFQYDPTVGEVIEDPGRAAEVRASYCMRVRTEPLSMEVLYDNTLLSWSLGPYTTGIYSLVFLCPASRFDLPRQGSSYIPFRRPLDIQARYESPAGWVTYSPPLHATIEGGRARLVWRRPAR